MISIIAVVGKNNELGFNNELLWHLPNDLKFFKETTMGKPVIMGHNTFVSIGRVLPGRENIVISSEKFDGVTMMSVEDVLEKYLDADEEVFVIGGAKMYDCFLEYASKIYLTEVPLSKEADVYFPSMNYDNYTKINIKSNNDGDISYDHVLYEKRK